MTNAKPTGPSAAGPTAPRETRRLVDLTTAARHADVSVRTLRRYISQGRLTGYRIGPRLVRVDLNEIHQLARRIPTARQPAD